MAAGREDTRSAERHPWRQEDERSPNRTGLLASGRAMFGVFFFVNGFQAALEVAAIIAFAGALTAVLLIRHTPSAEPEASTETIAA